MELELSFYKDHETIVTSSSSLQSISVETEKVQAHVACEQ